jgi:hypothetical protein
MLKALLILFYSPFLFAGFSLNRTIDNRLILSDSCTELMQRMFEIKEWTLMIEKRECKYSEPKTSNEGMCIVDATDCVPEYVKKYHGLSPADHGPNCWNLALVMSGLLPVLRESSPEEWEFYLTSPLCRQLDPNEPPEMGDIGSIEARSHLDKGHVHGFIYVSDTISYSKNGTTISAPYSLQPLSRIIHNYGVGRLVEGECMEMCGPQKLTKFMDEADTKKYPKGVPDASICYLKLPLDPILKQACADLKKFVKNNQEDCKVCQPSALYYYRCERLEDFVKKQNFKDQENMADVDELIQEMECHFQKGIFHFDESHQVKETLLDTIKVLDHYLSTHQNLSKETKEEKFIYTSFAVRLKELHGQLRDEMPNSELSKIFYKSMSELTPKD